MNFYRRFRDAAAVVLLLALPFFFLNANLKDPSRTNAIDRLLLQLSAPAQSAATQLALGVSGIWEEYLYLVEVKQDNQRLRDENARLREANHRLTSDAAENRRLRRLLHLRDELEGTMLSARVIAKGHSVHFRVTRLELDRGERDRVKHGMPVVTPEGLVGQIQRAAGHYSDVLLVADATSAVDVVIERNGARGILRGTGLDDAYKCQIEHLSREDDVKVGDLVVTSGLGQRFPASIVVGEIVKVEKPAFGLYQQAEVRPAVNFSRLEEVLIMTSGPRSQITGELSVPRGGR